ncbi:hypothetical protein BDQ12DRAFT_512503 [Crucibulum laeve]|uniref:F-box domain-containing protein n=1 Tax=Crucibulum laeve TaxID=68775 RepID=A0A5C3M620_9AGAR|nr:hypothetical protein BDQ12DRAFT_512503 [Crucibulum laeve]
MQPPAQVPPVPPPEEEPQELARFREEWKAELQRRRAATAATQASSSPPQPASSSESTLPASPPAKVFVPVSVSQPRAGPSKNVLPETHPALNGTERPTYVSPGLGNALSIYRQAVYAEQRSDLDEALLLYRQAFRLDPHVDRAYHREEMLASILQGQTAAVKKLTVSAATDEEVEQLASNLQNTLALSKPVSTGKAVVTGTLASLISGFPQELAFEPENELESVPIKMLPDELLVLVLKKLDPTSIERFARVNKKLRVLSLDSTIWRNLVSKTYRPPQIPDIEYMIPVIEKHLSDFRRVYIEQPRVRFDGVYIAICHYVRPGLSENSWVNISHLITYHRYLRFLPNGQVLSLLANEEHSPQQVIPLLKPSLRMKGFFLGNWHLEGTTLHLTNLIDASGRFVLQGLEPPSSAPIHSHLHHSSNTTSEDRARYVFVMSLNLRSRPLGRWNRLDMETYESISLETGDATPVALKHDRPFWFSKVRSYGLQV